MNFIKITGGIFVLNLLFILASASLTQAQTDDVQRIEFGAGQMSATVGGKIKGDSSVQDYAVRVPRVGQVMSVKLISKNRRAYFSIICPGCTEIGDTPFGMKDAYKTRRWKSVVPDSGNYTIRISADKSVAFDYTLEVSVRDQNLIVEKPRFVRRITGTYMNKNNSLDARLLPNGDMKFHLIAIWKSPVNREVIHLGEIQAIVPMQKNNLAIYEKGQCRVVLEFLLRAVEISQSGSDADCDFGANIFAAGTYRKQDGHVPKLDF